MDSKTIFEGYTQKGEFIMPTKNTITGAPDETLPFVWLYWNFYLSMLYVYLKTMKRLLISHLFFFHFVNLSVVLIILQQQWTEGLYKSINLVTQFNHWDIFYFLTTHLLELDD